MNDPIYFVLYESIFNKFQHLHYRLRIMKIKNITQLTLDLSASAFFVLLSMTIISFVIPSGFNTKFLLLSSKFTVLVLVALL